MLREIRRESVVKKIYYLVAVFKTQIISLGFFEDLQQAQFFAKKVEEIQLSNDGFERTIIT